MRTIPGIVEDIIRKKPFLESALIEGIVNLSSLARKIRPEVEDKLDKEVNDSAIIMALNRLVPRLELVSIIKFKKVVEKMGDVIVRSNLADFAFANSKSLYKKQAVLLEKIKSMRDVFCTFSQGVSESTIVVSASIIPLVKEVFAEEHLIAECGSLSSITVKLPAENSIYPGVYYYIFKELAWENINVTEVISTTNEFTVIVSDKDIHRAFQVLMESKKQLQRF